MKNQYSVLMSVYYKEQPENLRQAIESMLNQTIVTNDFVLICDGPLTSELDMVIEKYEKCYPKIFRVLRLETNMGLGSALNAGLAMCKNELVARMDSDDISLPNRCEKQLEAFENEPGLDVVSGFVAEFCESQDEITAIKSLPERQKEIYEYAKRRNPINHPCVMYKKTQVLKAGNYQSFYLLEDYYLWIRMMNLKMHFYNIQEVLLKMRAGKNMYERRGNLKYFRSFFLFRKYMKKIQFIGITNFIITVLGQFLVCVVPNSAREKFYKVFLRG